MSQEITIVRIPALNPGGKPKANYELAVYNRDTNATERVTADWFLNAEQTGNYDWDAVTNYDTGEAAFYSGKLWVSLINGNVGNTPVEGPNWTQVTQQTGSSLKPWAAGGYADDNVYVTYNNLGGPDSNEEIFKLVNPVRPFNSTDIAAEIIAGDWVSIIPNTGSTPVFDGNRPVATLPSIGDNYGTGTVQDFLEAAYFGYVQAVASFTGSVINRYEVGDVVTPNSISGNITPNASTITARVIKDTVAAATVATPASNSFSESVPDVNVIQGLSARYRLELTTDEDGTFQTGADKQYIGYHPVLFGMAAPGLTGNALYVEMNKWINSSNAMAFTYDGVSLALYLLYPSYESDLVSAKDPNGFEQLGSLFPALPALDNITSSGLANNYVQQYKVYESLPSTVNSGTFTFTR